MEYYSNTELNNIWEKINKALKYFGDINEIKDHYNKLQHDEQKTYINKLFKNYSDILRDVNIDKLKKTALHADTSFGSDGYSYWPGRQDGINIFFINWEYLNSISDNYTIQSSLIHKLQHELQFNKNQEKHCLDELKVLANMGRVSFSDDIIVIEYNPSYEYIIGLIEYWEKEKRIKIIKQGKYKRIINCFKWRDVKQNLKDFDADTLSSRKKDMALSQVINDLK